jgi:2-polyprenyl-6-methoxyphenol hydroxylase-like FAD-dependent oxidoreductase
MKFLSSERVLVGGAGVGGLAVVRALYRRSIPALALERRAEPADAGLAINLPGNAIRALADLGLAEELQTVGSPVRRREYRNERGRLLFAVDEDAFWGADARPRCIRRSDLLRLLSLGLPAGAVRRNSGIEAVRHDQQGVAVQLTDGTVEKGEMLVGADGVHSTVRRDVLGDTVPEAARLARASWRFMTPNPGVDSWSLWAGAGSLFLLIPVDRGEAYGWMTADIATMAGNGLSALHAAFESFPLLVRDTLARVVSQPASLYHSPLEEVRARDWHRGRVLLAGDAAHATAPVWAQGAALALEDALVLADVIATEPDWKRVGAEYELRRRPRVAHVQAMTDRLSRTARMPGWTRTFLLPVLGPHSYRATYAPLRSPVAD